MLANGRRKQKSGLLVVSCRTDAPLLTSKNYYFGKQLLFGKTLSTTAVVSGLPFWISLSYPSLETDTKDAIRIVSRG